MRTPIRPQARLSNSRRNQSAVDRGNQPQDKQRQSSRWLVSFCLFLFAGAMIFARLFYIQVYASEGLHQIAIEQRTISLVTQARRGTIYDRNGLVLATSVDTVSIYANTLQITNPEATAYLLAEVLGNDSEYWLEKISNPPANATNVCLARFADLQVQTDLLHRSQELEPYYLSISRLQSRLDPNGSPVWNAPTALSCVNFDHEYKRVYPYGSIGSQAIGTVNAEGRGISGIEMQYDQILTGQNGAIRVEIGYDGTPLPNGTRVEEPKADGEDIISIDIGLQEFIESELARYGELGRTDQGSVTVIDGATGEIYAAASLPLYNRDTLSEDDIVKGAMNLGGIIYPYEPGSTMKGVTCAGALELGVIDTEEVFFVPGTLLIDGYWIRDFNYRPDSDMNLREIIFNSSNVGMSMIGQRMGNIALFDYFFKAGFYQPTHVDYVGLDGMGEPLYTTDKIDYDTGAFISIADKPEYWSGIHAANLTFGQGLQVTALQMVSYYSAIANQGVICQPHFLISRPQSSSLIEYPSTRIMSESTALTMTSLLESVLTDGTGIQAQVPGYRIAGKTGTAEKASSDGGYSGDVTQSMVGYFIDSPCELTSMVVTDNSSLIGNSSAPKLLFASIMEYIANRYLVEPNSID